jgi:hypothetical protein
MSKTPCSLGGPHYARRALTVLMMTAIQCGGWTEIA